MYNRPRGAFAMLGISALGDPWIAAAQGRGPWEMPMMQGGWGMVMMLLMLLFWAAIIVVIIVGIRWLITSSRSQRQMTSERETPSALDILQGALCARGDQQTGI